MTKPNLIFSVLFSIAILFSSCESKIEDSGSTALKNESSDPLPSWNDVASKNSIIAYVTDVTNVKSKNFIPIEDRIATFDNDGNLWAEQPAYFQLFFAIDKVKAMSANHPEWKDLQPFKAVLDNDIEELKKQGEHGLIQLVMATHAGSTVEEFEADVKNWIATANHPTKNVTYDKLVSCQLYNVV